jgi:hypothetical protein
VRAKRKRAPLPPGLASFSAAVRSKPGPRINPTRKDKKERNGPWNQASKQMAQSVVSWPAQPMQVARRFRSRRAKQPGWPTLDGVAVAVAVLTASSAQTAAAGNTLAHLSSRCHYRTSSASAERDVSTELTRSQSIAISSAHYPYSYHDHYHYYSHQSRPSLLGIKTLSPPIAGMASPSSNASSSSPSHDLLLPPPAATPESTAVPPPTSGWDTFWSSLRSSIAARSHRLNTLFILDPSWFFSRATFFGPEEVDPLVEKGDHLVVFVHG